MHEQKAYIFTGIGVIGYLVGFVLWLVVGEVHPIYNALQLPLFTFPGFLFACGYLGESTKSNVNAEDKKTDMSYMVSVIVFVVGVILLVVGFYFALAPDQKLVHVKYRDAGLVDLWHPSFEYQNTSSSSFIHGAWYDESELYMIIKLKDTYYHYCEMSPNTWDTFTQTDSFGTFYEKGIQGRYSCRGKEVPMYR